MRIVHEAVAYTPAHDLGVVTCYFNPVGYASKRKNLDIFRAKMRENGIDCLTVECAFGEAPFELPRAPDVLQVRAKAVLFQKERLLNLAVARMPEHVTKVAWLDADILFENPAWAVETSRMLDTHALVQPFEQAFRLPPGARGYAGEGRGWKSFAAVYREDPTRFLEGRFDEHGHTGFAWAARKDVLLRHRIYDAMIAGSADHMIAHAALGDWNSSCIRRIVGTNNPYASDLRAWSRRFYADVKGALGHVPGAVLHLWHGEMTKRRYVERAQELVGFGFDPSRDICVDAASGAWSWSSDKPALHAWSEAYFALRSEDEAPERRAPEAAAQATSGR